MPLAAALLAGGKSTRMGFDKCLLEFEGQPLWRRQLDLLATVTEDVLVVAPVCPAWLPDGFSWIADAAADQGPLGALVSAFDATAQDQILLLAIDLPQMTANYLQRMIDLAGPNQSVVPEWGSHFEPLCALYARPAHAIAIDLLNSGEKSLQQLACTLQTLGLATRLKVSEEEHALFRNLNSPTD